MSTLKPVARRALFPALSTLLLLLSALWAAAGTPPTPIAPEPPGVPPNATGAALRVMNREVFVFRGELGPYQPEQRAASSSVLLEKAFSVSGKPDIAVRAVGENRLVVVNGHPVFTITPGDVNELEGETLDGLAQQTTQRLELALGEMAELRDRRSVLTSALWALAYTLLFVGAVWVLSRNRRWVEGRLIRITAEKADQLKSHTLRLVGLQNLVPLLRALMTAVFWLVVLVAGYFYVDHVLRLFPITRPLGEQLDSHLAGLLSGLAGDLLHALPNLAIVLVIWLLARFASAAAKRFFQAVQRGTIKSRHFDPATAAVSHRLCLFLIWVTAIIVAFPYIPGSQTPAFRGISVLAGLMISLGSSSLVTQVVSGLVIIYNRTCRTGDYVRIGDHEGTIRAIGFFSTRMVTVRNEEVVIPNNQISSASLVNYTRHDESGGVALPVKITIGYSTPWRQVHAMMREAARRTKGIVQQPEPAVLQNSLSDFYVEYQLNAVVQKPEERIPILSELNAHIQDVFNEYGVQIMSPHYRADPPQPAVVPKDKWHLPPAKPGA